MKITITLLLIFCWNIFDTKADEVPSPKTFNKKDIQALSDVYLKNNVNVTNPIVVDIDSDGDFDILKFTDKGKVEYFKNTGTLEKPEFTLENRNFDNYEINSFFPDGIPIPVFFADRDGDKDDDVFGIVRDESKNEVVYIENTMQLDHYTLITVILVLVIVLLIVLIAR